MVIEQVKQLIDFQGLTVSRFEKIIGASDGVIRRAIKNNTDIQAKWLEKIPEVYPETNLFWLLTGKGEVEKMIKNSQHSNNYITHLKLKNSQFMPDGAIPFYNIPVNAGNRPFVAGNKIIPDGYIKDLPGVTDTEFILPVRGFSMYPEVKEGAIIGVNTCANWEHLNTQHKYLIITKHDRMVKYIKYDKKHDSLLWCTTPDYPDFSILVADIITVYRVTFVMNPE